MKTKQQLLESEPLILGYFDNVDHVYSSFDVPAEDRPKHKILLAIYGGRSYEGRAFVLATDGIDLFEVHGGHCSCYGLEGQFNLERFVPEQFEKSVSGMFGTDEYDQSDIDKIKEFFGV